MLPIVFQELPNVLFQINVCWSLGSHSAIPLFAKEWTGSPAIPKLILAFIFPLIENTGQLPMPIYFWEYLQKLVYQKVFKIADFLLDSIFHRNKIIISV
jgi:hypothetical protein